MFSSIYRGPANCKVDLPYSHPKSKFVDYATSTNTNSHPIVAPTALTMGELHHFAALHGRQELTSLPRSGPLTATTTSPSSKTSRMTDSPSSDSMDSSSMIESHYHGHGKSRKQRRGIIEKKRRDRINNSLAELRRLVPSAFEKQGSTKLEKAEILQLTVDHLKTMHSKGINYAPNGIDAHLMGFQECVAEIVRFVGYDEMFTAQEQLKNRLISHLQCYTAQKQSTPSNPQWVGHYPTGPTGLVPPAPPAGLTKWDAPDSMAPSCLGTTGVPSYTTTPMFSGPTASQYSGFPTNHMQSMYMNAAASSQANYASTRPVHRPWGHEMVYC